MISGLRNVILYWKIETTLKYNRFTEMIEENKGGLYMLDNELGARTAV